MTIAHLLEIDDRDTLLKNMFIKIDKFLNEFRKCNKIYAYLYICVDIHKI